MPEIILKNAPLTEVIFEMKWDFQDIPNQASHYSLIIGRLYDKINKEYTLHEPLPTSSIPFEMANGIVQHRFRRAKNQWPLIQLGPGILTFNDINSYQWDNFSSDIVKGVNQFFDIHAGPQKNNLEIDRLGLRYINTIDFNFVEDDILKFLKDNLKINISFPPSLFEDTGIKNIPSHFDNRFSFLCTQPKATINVRFTRGKISEKDVLIWEMVINASNEEVPHLPADLSHWLNDAHHTVENWFFKLIEGDLLERFK